MRYYLTVLLPFLFSWVQAPHKANGKVLVVQQCPYDYHSTLGDTIYIRGHCFYEESINDSVLHYCGADTANITTIIIGSPDGILQHMRFDWFPRLHHLILAGNDADYIDDERYDFFSNPNLKVITVSSVYLRNRAGDPLSNKHFKRFVKSIRRDIKVRVEPMGYYNRICWP